MKSFDVFDTLLVRRYGDNKQILADLLGRKYNERIEADNGQRNIYEIYEAIGLTREDAQKEIMAEADNSYLNKSIYDKINHGDILISDMYIPAYDILQILRHNGFDKQVTIYQSNSDKSNGSAYVMANELGVTNHYGDNPYSDIIVAKNYGINAHEIRDCDFGYVFIPEVNYFIRELRLRINPANKFLMRAIDTAIPLCLFAMEVVHRKANGRPIAFLGRDCQIMHKLYTSVYNVPSYYVPFSRKMAFSDPVKASAYLNNSAPEDAMYVDLSSTGNTWDVLKDHFKRDVFALIYSNTNQYTDHIPQLPINFNYLTSNTEIGSASEIIEAYFCGNHDCVTSVNISDSMMTIGLTNEENSQLANDIHDIVGIASKIVKYYNIKDELKELTKPSLKLYFDNYVTLIHIINS
jgi:predicted HAD superfamily hydrolase